MKIRSAISYTSKLTLSIKALFITCVITGCASVPNIVPQLPTSGSVNPTTPVVGQDIARANGLLAAGRKREAADAYFIAANNYGSPERERLILQAAELAAVFKDTPLTQQYLSPINYDQLSLENKSRFRVTQAQLALNDRNYRETLRILPQRVNDVPADLGKKILDLRLSAAQSSGDKLALIQELVLQEPTLKEQYLVSLNQDRIWGHARQIPEFQLQEGINRISHPTVKNWLSLAQLSRVYKYGPASKKRTFRSDLGRWIQSNPNHPGMTDALALLNAAPTTIVTPYSADVQKTVLKRPVAKKPIVKRPIVKKPIVTKPTIKRAPVKRVPIKRPPVVVVKKPVVIQPKTKTPVKIEPGIRSLYEKFKKQVQ